MNDLELYNIVEEKKVTGKTWEEVATEMGRQYNDERSANAWSKWHNRRKNGDIEIGPALEVDNITMGPDDTIIEKIWAETNLDPNQWEIEKISTWGQLDNLNVSAKFKVRQVPPELLFEEIRNRLNREWSINSSENRNTGILLVPALFDAHIGKLAAINTEDYFLGVLEDLVEKTIRGYGNIDQVLFPLGQDFSHIDNVDNATSKGTPLEVNASYADIISTQVTVATKAVEYLAERFPTHVAMVPGNHDRLSNEWLGHVIKGRFHNHPNVVVDGYQGSYEPRKYYIWGETVIAMTHGNEENLNTIGNLIASEMRSAWGETSRCEVLLGHLHTMRDKILLTDERNGIMLRYMPSLGDTDTWHKLKGFVHNGRGGIGLIYCKKYGWQDTYSSALEKFL